MEGDNCDECKHQMTQRHEDRFMIPEVCKGCTWTQKNSNFEAK